MQLEELKQSTSPNNIVLPFESDVVDAEESPTQEEGIGIRRFLVLPDVALVKRCKT
jgi:hypothetical protein